MATGCTEQNVPTLKTCYEQISHIFEEERKDFKAKVSKLEEEKGVLYGLLKTRNDLEKENVDIKKENKVMKEEISFLHLTSKESQAKISELENKYEQHRKSFTKKQSEWARYAHMVRKKCTCNFNDNFKKSSDSLMSTPSLKIKNVSNVFFMSPVKTKFSDNGAATLAPMTEEYNGDQHFKASTPMVVGETERSPRLHYEINSSDNESDDERVCSPSLFTDHDSKVETPAYRYKKEKHLKTVSIDLCKPSPMDRLTLASPMDRLTLTSQKHERTETSAVLFSDNNDDNGHKVNDVSSESNVDFHRSSADMPKERVKPSRTVKTEEEEEEIKVVQHRNSCLKEPSQPVLKKRKYVSREEEVNEAVHQNISNTKNNSSNQTWACGNNIINPRNNTTNPMVRKKDADKANKNMSANVENNKNNKINYKYSTVVRKKHEREKLSGFACEECRRYYESDKLSKEELAAVLKNCSRHKHVSAPPPSTPEQFWALDFPQTQDCIDKGYMLDENQTLPDHVKPKGKRTKKKKNVNFK